MRNDASAPWRYQQLSFRGVPVLTLDTLPQEYMGILHQSGVVEWTVTPGVHDSVLLTAKPFVHPALRVSDGL